ncbi:YeeE/YedE thiosulfate transporter family protein [Aeoliella sp.]|uniref:YeeE/YedE thiosulfate transporter family protein n=1 Tax=Aeoliella sp. TaxID=2795800 RepID=UPI003CCB7E90
MTFSSCARDARIVKRRVFLYTMVFLWPATNLQATEDLPSPYPYPEPAWSPYLVGGLIGLLVLTTLALAGKKIGASSGYSDAAGMIGRLVAPAHIASLPYYQENRPMIGWTLTIVLGAILGAFVAAWSGGELTGTYLQDMWVARFGSDSAALRTGVALIGGALMAFGARMAGGCTSGHGISGTLQLAVSSWIAVCCFFVGGIATAILMYRM